MRGKTESVTEEEEIHKTTGSSTEINDGGMEDGKGNRQPGSAMKRAPRRTVAENRVSEREGFCEMKKSMPRGRLGRDSGETV